MKRVLFVDHVNRILGGAEINIIELLTSKAAGDSWEIACACASDGRLHDELSGKGIRTFAYSLGDALNTLRVVGKRFSPSRVLSGISVMRKAREELAKIIESFKPDVVVGCTNKDQFVLTPLCRRLGIPAVWWVNDVISSEFFPLSARVAFHWRAKRGASRIVTVSEFAREALLDAGLSGELVQSIHNGIPLDLYSRREKGAFRREFSLPEDEPVVAIVGRWTPWKGQMVFLEMAKHWVERESGGRFLLIGHAFNEDQGYERELRDFVESNRLGDHVHFIPFQKNIAASLTDTNVVVHASTRPEPFGRVLIEAMAMGVPVIGARAGAVPEIITSGHDGFLAAPGDAEDYFQQLRHLLKSKEEYDAIARNGEATVRERFTIERVHGQFDHLFEQVISQA